MKEIRVNFAPQIKKLEVSSKRGAFGYMSGEYRSLFKGKGLEFTGYRMYMTSDDASEIDWKASLRAQELLVRELVEERNLEVIFVVDVSSSMCFASIDMLKCEYAAEVVGSLAFSILSAGDSVGLIMFTDKIVQLIHPNLGTRQFFLVSKALSNPAYYEGKVDYTKMMNFLGDFVKKNSVVIIVSDFLGMTGPWRQSLRILGQKFDLVGLMVRDPIDNALPDVGQVAISDPFSGQEIMIDTGLVGKEYEQNSAEQRKKVFEAFKEAGSDLMELSTDKPFAPEIGRFFMMRKAKWK